MGGSVIVARGWDGKMVHFPVQRNLHREGILAVTEVYEGNIAGALAGQAVAATRSVAEGLGYVVHLEPLGTLPADKTDAARALNAQSGEVRLLRNRAELLPAVQPILAAYRSAEAKVRAPTRAPGVLETGAVDQLGLPFTEVEYVEAAGETAVFIASSPRRAPAVIRLHIQGDWTPLTTSNFTTP